MTTFVATEFRDDREFGVQLQAPDWSEAERICDQEGWRLDGELVCVLPAGTLFDDVVGIVDQMQRGGLN